MVFFYNQIFSETLDYKWYTENKFRMVRSIQPIPLYRKPKHSFLIPTWLNIKNYFAIISQLWSHSSNYCLFQLLA